MINVSDDGHVADIGPLVHDSTNLREGGREGGRGEGGGREGEGEKEGGKERERRRERRRERGEGEREREREREREVIKCFMNVITHYSAAVGMQH